MKPTRRWIGFIFILSLIFVVCCLYRASLKVTAPPTARISNYETGLIYVTTMVPDSSEEVGILEEFLIKNINKYAIFKDVLPASRNPNASTDLRLNAKILALKKAGLASTFFPGGGSGVIVEVTLIDVKTNTNIGVFEAERVGTFSGSTTKDVLFDIAKRVAEYLKENK